jgi:hypothetical protein
LSTRLKANKRVVEVGPRWQSFDSRRLHSGSKLQRAPAFFLMQCRFILAQTHFHGFWLSQSDTNDRN